MTAQRALAALVGVSLLALACGPSSGAPAAPAAPAKGPAASAPSAPGAASPGGGASTAPAAAPATASAPTPVGFGLASVNALYWPMYVAKAKGFDQVEGIDLELVQLGSSARVVQATVSGSIQVGLGSPDSVVTATQQGANIVMFGGNINKPIYGVVARPEIQTLDDIRGKTVGASSLTTGEVVFLKTILARHGLEAGRDYDVLVAGGPPERLVALKAGSIAATVLIEPQESQLLAEGYRRLARTADYFPEYQFHALFAMRDWLNANEDTAVRFLRTLIRSNQWLRDQSNKEEAAKILTDATNTDIALSRSTYDSYVVEQQAFPRQAELSVSASQAVVNTLGEPAPDVSRWIDLRYHDKAAAGMP
jgi:ABC-type nitrate/sulfonate/bicarbonate transport system substrate-binding protein